MTRNCPNCGAALNDIGRKRGKYPVQNVLNDYQVLQNIGAVAEKNNLSKGTVWRILKEANINTKRK
jgi:hypothetical protein